MKKFISTIVLLLTISFVTSFSDLCVGKPSGTTLANPDSHLTYFVCERGTGVELNCAINHYYSDLLGRCIRIDTFTAEVTTTEEYTTTTTEPTCAGLPDGSLLPNAESCTEFFLCLFQVAIPATCPEPQYFNPKTFQCDDPENVICDDGSTTTVEPSICADIPNGQLINDPMSCSSFFVCIDNDARPAQCPLELYFDKDTQSCRSPDNVDCITPTTTTTEEPTTTTEEPFIDACVGIPDGTLVDNPSGCEAFFLCLGELAISGTCPPPALFNHERAICDRPENVDCWEYETTTEPVNLCYDKEDFTFVDDPQACEGYFLCFNGQPLSRTCPDGFYFDPSISICSPSDQVTCGEQTETTPVITTEEITTEEITTEEITTEEIITTTTSTNSPPLDSCPATGIISIPNQQQCSRFILCANGIEVNMACATDHHFNFGTQTCLHRDIANCEIPLPICDFEQSSTVPIALHHPQYCEKFFICFLGQITQFECNAGLHFDIHLEQCLPWIDVGCEV